MFLQEIEIKSETTFFKYTSVVIDLFRFDILGPYRFTGED